VSEDARNSVYLWVGGLTFFGLYWASLHFEVFSGVSKIWLWPMLGIVTVINLAQTSWRFWKRRASEADKPSQN